MRVSVSVFRIILLNLVKNQLPRGQAFLHQEVTLQTLVCSQYDLQAFQVWRSRIREGLTFIHFCSRGNLIPLMTTCVPVIGMPLKYFINLNTNLICNFTSGPHGEHVRVIFTEQQ